MKPFELLKFDSTEALATAAAKIFLDEVAAANHHERVYSVALSGGRIANNFYDAIVKHAREEGVAMAHVHFFWADERCVPADDAESNYKTANDLLLKPLSVPVAHVHRIHGEETPEVAAKKASADILETLPANANGQPIMDLIILGIGPDGHTASLFPREPESMVHDKVVYRAVFNSPKPPPNRVTLGYQTIAAAKDVWVLVSGDGKEKIFAESLQSGSQTPFARVLKLRSETKIFSDLKNSS